MDILIFGLQVSAIGMGIVFVALFVLQLLIDNLSQLIAKIENKGKNVSAPVVSEPTSVVAEEDDAEVVVVIMVAIASYAAAENTKYNITSIKRVDRSNGWGSAGRQQLMQDRVACL